MTGFLLGALALWAIMATVGWLTANSAISEFTSTLASINLSLDKLEKHVQPLATLKVALDKERADREKMALIQGDEDRRDWKSV